MAYELMVETWFSASHTLRGYQGDCARLHGHNWKVELYLRCSELNDIGIAVDYKVLKKALKDAVSKWDHYHMNDIPPFDKINPSSENIARVMFEEMTRRLNDENTRISRIVIGETCATRVAYWPD